MNIKNDYQTIALLTDNEWKEMDGKWITSVIALLIKIPEKSKVSTTSLVIFFYSRFLNHSFSEPILQWIPMYPNLWDKQDLSAVRIWCVHLKNLLWAFAKRIWGKITAIADAANLCYKYYKLKTIQQIRGEVIQL